MLTVILTKLKRQDEAAEKDAYVPMFEDAMESELAVKEADPVADEPVSEEIAEENKE